MRTQNRCIPTELARATPVDGVAIGSNMTLGGAFSPLNPMKIMKHSTSAILALWSCLGVAVPARADLRMCNNTGNRVSVALAYTDGQGWVSEGWWNLKSLDCATLLRGALAAQYYYVYAMDERGGEWKGKAFMCTSDREFKIEGREDCFMRGYDRTGFFEVDTGKDAKSWTVQLTDQANP